MSRILNSKILSVLLSVVLIWLGLSLLDLRVKDKLMYEQAMGLEGKIETTKKENSNLERYIGYLQNPSFLAKEARLKLNYKAPDEQVVFVYRDSSPKKASQSFEERLAGMKNYQKWWYWLVGY